MRMTVASPGQRLREAVEAEHPLQIVGTINAYSALLAARSGFRAVYLSGAGVANASFGLPDLGITSLNDVCEDAGAFGNRLGLDAAFRFGVPIPDDAPTSNEDRASTSPIWYKPSRGAAV